MGSSENQARMRVTRNGLEDLTRLLGGKRSIPLQQSGSMPQRNVQCPNGLRNVVQLSIQSRPRISLDLTYFFRPYKSLPRSLCQIRNRRSSPIIRQRPARKSPDVIAHTAQ